MQQLSQCPCFGRRKKAIGLGIEDKNPIPDVKTDKSSVETSEKSEPELESPVPKDSARAKNDALIFSYRELANATNNFRQESVIGEGGFGVVYKGWLERTGQNVAVKQLNLSGAQGEKEFLVEVLMLSLLRHPNLVHLIGYCAEGKQRLLVYEFMPLGSLEYRLHEPPDDTMPLDWNTRMNIAAGAARGLNYLHNEADPPVIYRDLKSSNILLGNGFHTKLSDFGLAKFGPDEDKSHVSTRVMGTQGYCAPEYAGTGKLTMKSDIYTFGIVLLELITGQRALDTTRGQGKHMLVDWAHPMLRERKRFVSLADPQLEGKFSEPIVRRAVEVALMCLREDPHLRPSMSDIVVAVNYLASQEYEPSKDHSTRETNLSRGEGESETDSGKSNFVESKDTTKLLKKDPDRERAVAEAKVWGEAWRDKRRQRTQSDTDDLSR